jgi:hypothetical protein
MRDFGEIEASINNLLYDIKAEAIIVDLIENNLNPGDIVFIPDGSFKRKFKRDISHAEVIKLENDQKVLGIHITRDGFYDVLPEGLFHNQVTEPLKTGREMAKESKKQKIEEKEARKFFLPFENEIFLQRILLEIEERKILNRFSENLFDDIRPEFWNLDKNLPRKFISRMVLLLHFTHRISGNPELTAKSLETIIEEPVKINLVSQKQSQKKGSSLPEENVFTVGSVGLGIDSVCGQHIDDVNTAMEFVIGPLKNSSVEDYLENGSISKFLDCFFGYFVPVEMDVVTTINIESGKQDFIMSDETSNAILGYNSII